MSTRRRTEQQSLPILAILASLDSIDPRPYDFPVRLEVPDAVLLGELPFRVQQLHAARMQAAQEIADLEAQLKVAKRRFGVLDGLFDQGVLETFPPNVQATQTPTGIEAKLERAVFFGSGWKVWSAPPDSVAAAMRDHERESGRGSRSAKDLVGALLGGINLG